jgi:phenylacetate-CoA ligase
MADKTMSGWRRALFVLYTETMPLHAWMLSSNVRKYYDELQASQWWPSESIREYQDMALRQLIQHAYDHVPFYHKRFQVRGATLPRTVAELQQLPLLDKQTIRNHIDYDLMSDNHDPKKILKVTTSGSTGEPFVMYADQHQLEKRWAANMRAIEWTGYRFGDRQARLWHQTIGMSRSQIIQERLDAWFNRRMFIPAYEMTDENLPATLKRLEKFNPQLIDGYAESFNFLARHCTHGELLALSPKGIISSAQVLPPQSRRVIESAFCTQVFDKYGSREFSGIAYESDAHDGHLVTAENYIVEILKDGRVALPGELGEVVITDLNNYCMPLIRYRIGDLAVAMDNNIQSPCGRGLPRIGRIEGRAQAIIKGTNGRYLPGTFFMHYFKDFEDCIRQFQITQEHLGELQVNIVRGERFDHSTFAAIMTGLRPYVGTEMIFTIRYLDSIPLGRTGKHQATISTLRFDVQNVEINQCVPNQT